MEDLGQLVKLRREKLDELRGMEIPPYMPTGFISTPPCLPWWKSIPKNLKKN